MSTTFSTFERLKSKGIAAYENGEYLAARAYLVDAAECMIELAEKAKSAEARRQHEEIAAHLIDLARDAEALAANGAQVGRAAPRGGAYSAGQDGGAGGVGAAGRGAGGGTSPAGQRGPVPQGRAGARPGARSPGRAGAGRPGAARQGAEEDGGADPEEWIVRDKPTTGFDDIAGLDNVKEEIRLKMIYPFAHAELADRYGITRGGGVLLYGPPGTGKTMIAKAIAHEIEATFFLVSPAQVMSKWVGEAEQNIRKLFEAAKAEPAAIIFLDEVEALVPKRKSDSSTVMQRVVPQILQELEGFDRKAERALLFVGATNRPWMLDEAMMRPGRMDAKIYVPLPDAPARYRLLEIYLGKRPLADDVDFAALTDKLDGYSGADIKALAEEAAQRPFLEAIGGAEARPVTMADVVSAMEQARPSVHPSDMVRFEEFAREGV